MKIIRWLVVVALIVWARPLHAITYEDALEIAFSQNINLSLADLGIDEAEEGLIQARSAFHPRVKFSGSYTRLGTVPIMNFEVMPGVEFAVPMGTADNYSAGFSISVPIFLGGKRAWAEEMAHLGIGSAREEALMARAELHPQVTAAFYGLMLAEEAENIFRADLERAESQLGQTRARWQRGYASSLDLKQDEVALSRAEAALLQAENYTIQAQQFLNMVLGQPVSEPIRAEGSLEIVYEEWDADSLVDRALALRPEIASLERAERISELGRNLARSAYSPSLVFVASPTWQNPYQQAEGWGSSMAATVAVEWPLYDGGKGLSEARVADIGIKKLIYARSQAEDGIELEVRQAYASWMEAYQQLLVQQTLGEQMVELADMAEDQYRMGVISALDYQSIMISKTQVDLARLSALYRMILAREQLAASAWLWDAETLQEFETCKENLK